MELRLEIVCSSDELNGNYPFFAIAGNINWFIRKKYLAPFLL